MDSSIRQMKLTQRTFLSTSMKPQEQLEAWRDQIGIPAEECPFDPESPAFMSTITSLAITHALWKLREKYKLTKPFTDDFLEAYKEVKEAAVELIREKFSTD